MSLIKNASPQIILLGAKDESTRVVPSSEIPLPQFLPIFFVYTKKGPTSRVVADSAGIQAAFGSDTLDSTKKYFNHQSRYLRDCLTYNASVMVQRIVPSDAGVKANAIIYIDVLKTKVINYKRNSDGSLIPNNLTNDYEIDTDNPTIEGYRVKWIKEYVDAGVEDSYGKLKSKLGTMIDSATGKRSTMYPIFDVRAMYQGEDYNNIGFSIGSFYGDDMNEKVKEHNLCLPYKLSLFTRINSSSNAVQFNTLYDEPYTLFSFKQDALNPETKAKIQLENIFESSFFNESNEDLPLVYRDYENFYFYRENFDKICKMFLETEKKYVTIDESEWADGEKASTLTWYDFTSYLPEELEEQYGMMNPFSCRTSKNVRYFTVQYDDGIATYGDGQVEVNMANDVPIFLEGGSDGTMDDEHYEAQVSSYMDEYGDENGHYVDLAVNVENILIDSGFSLELKEKMTNFILVRKDTALILSTHVASLGKEYYNLSDSRAIGTALKTRLRLCPESTYYGTPVARAIVLVGAGLLRDGSTDERIPLTYELMMKSSKMMGSGDGKWKSTYIFDRALDSDTNPGSKLQYLISVEPEYIPGNVKPSLWNAGLVWAQPFNRSSYHFPALQTIYEDDTSVLNNYFSMIALSTITKIAASCWRNFTGTTSLTDNEFIAIVNEWMRKQTTDLFADMFNVTPEAYMTSSDKLRGYSWNLDTILEGTVSKTVCTYTSIIRRRDDEETSA